MERAYFNDDIWVGLKDLQNSLKYYDSLLPAIFTPSTFERGERASECVQYYHDEGRFDDTSCGDKQDFVCERGWCCFLFTVLGDILIFEKK